MNSQWTLTDKGKNTGLIVCLYIFQLLMCGMRKYSVTDLKANHVVVMSTPSFRRVSRSTGQGFNKQMFPIKISYRN